MANYPNYGGINFGPYNNGYYNPMQSQYQPQIPVAQQRSNDGKVYVSGRAGADAYPMPNGVNEITLWDTDARRFYVKGYDNNGMPRVLEDCDYTPHVQQEPTTVNQVDLSKYATKNDIEKMIEDAFTRFQSPDMSSYITKDYFNKRLSGLSVGNGGRIVSNDESNG